MGYTQLYPSRPIRSLLSVAVLASPAAQKSLRTKPAVFGAVFWHYMQALRDGLCCDFIHSFAHDTDNLIHISKAGPTFNARTASLYC
jgi:hypothetical protein